MGLGGGGKTLYVRLATNIGSFRGEMAAGAASVTAFGSKVDKSMERLATSAEKNKKAIRGIGNVAGGVGLLAAVGIGVAVKKYAEFDKQMSNVRAATHASASEMAALSALSLKLGADTQYSAIEAGQGVEELAKAGVTTADILNGGLKGALDLAAAGELAVGDAAELAATAMTQFQLSGDQVPHVADLIAAGAGKAQGSAADLGQALNQVGLVADGMGLSIEDTTGTLAAFAKAGLIGSDAGTSFKTMIQRLQAPMGRGKKAMDELGISAYDGEGKFIGITAVAGELQDKLKGLTAQQRNAALAQIFGSDAVRAGTLLYRNGAKGIQGWIDKTNDSGYAAETARLRMNNLAGDIEYLRGSLDTMFVNMGKGANGPLRQIVQSLEGMVNVAGALPAPVLSTVAAALALTAAFGLTVFAATRLVGAVSTTRQSIALLRTQMVETAAAGKTFAAGMTLAKAGRGAAVLTGLTLATTSLGDSFGLANTAQYALMGSIAGPWGAAIGGGIGLLKDFASSGDATAKSFDALNASATDLSNLSGMDKALAKMTSQYDDLESTQTSFGHSMTHMFSDLPDNIKTIFGGGELKNAKDDLAETTKATEDLQFGIQALQDQTYGAKDGVNELFDPAVAQDFLNKVGPVLKKTGIDIQSVLEAGPKGKNWGTAVAAIEEYRSETETTAGRQKVLVDALGSVDTSLTGTADSATKLSKALDGLFSPTMDLDAATQKWRDGLAALRGELAKNGTSISNNTVQGRANREVIRDQIDALSGQMTAAAKAGKSTEDLALMMKDGRAKMIESAVAAGVNGKAMSKLLDYYGLTPDLVETLIKATGTDKTKGEIEEILSALHVLSATTAHPNIRVISNAKGEIAGIQRTINTVQGKVVEVTINQRTMRSDAFGEFNPGAGKRGAIVPHYASGNLAQITRAGVPKAMWGEAETQGEAYIPFAMDRRRRSTRILGLTAKRFGYDLSPRGMSGAGGAGTVIVQNAAPGPLIGSVTIPAMPGQSARPVMRELSYEVRRIQRGGRYS